MVWQEWQSLWQFYQSPKHGWQTLKQRPFTLPFFVLLLSLPAGLLWIVTTQLGWQIDDKQRHFLTLSSATQLAVAMTLTLIIATLLFATFLHRLSPILGQTPTYQQCLQLVLCSGSPLLVSSLSVLTTDLATVAIFGLFATAFSIHLLYKGIPILMGIPKAHAFFYNVILITGGSVILITMLILTVLLWDLGVMPHLVLL